MNLQVSQEKPRFYHRLNRARVLVQIGSLLFFIAIPILNRFEISALLGTLYAVSIGGLDVADPVMVLQAILLTKSIYFPLLLATVVPIVLALVFGRVFCSWICVYNTLGEWLDAAGRKLLPKRWRQQHHFKHGHNPPKYRFWLIFAILLLSVPIFGIPLLSYLSAPGLITSAISQAILGMGIGVEILLVVAVLAAEALLLRRFWCKYICPVGACLVLFQTKKTLRLTYDGARCDCKPGTAPCYSVCPLHLAPKDIDSIYPYCLNCGLCVEFCERTGDGALQMRFGLPGAKHDSNRLDETPLVHISRNK